MKSFLQCGLPEKILKILEKKDIETPFPIQMQVGPFPVREMSRGHACADVRQRRDRCCTDGLGQDDRLPLAADQAYYGSAAPGEWRRADWLLRAWAKPFCFSKEPQHGFEVAPTRELALQIQREASVFCKAVNLTSVCAYGGGPMGEQLSALKKGPRFNIDM